MRRVRGTLRKPGSAGERRGTPGSAGERWGARKTGPRAPGSVQLPRGRAEAPGAVTGAHRRSVAPWGWRGCGLHRRAKPPGSATRWRWGQWRALSRRRPAATRARRETRPLCRAHAGRAAAPGPTLLRPLRPSLSPPGPRPVPAVSTSLPAPSTALWPHPIPTRSPLGPL